MFARFGRTEGAEYCEPTRATAGAQVVHELNRVRFGHGGGGKRDKERVMFTGASRAFLDRVTGASLLRSVGRLSRRAISPKTDCVEKDRDVFTYFRRLAETARDQLGSDPYVAPSAHQDPSPASSAAFSRGPSVHSTNFPPRKLHFTVARKSATNDNTRPARKLRRSAAHSD